jgi:hypothetical protein
LDEQAYGRVMQAFAGRVAALRGLAHIERGTSRAGALATLALLMFPVLAFTAIAVALMEHDDWPGWTAGGARSAALGDIGGIAADRRGSRGRVEIAELTIRRLPSERSLEHREQRLGVGTFEMGIQRLGAAPDLIENVALLLTGNPVDVEGDVARLQTRGAGRQEEVLLEFRFRARFHLEFDDHCRLFTLGLRSGCSH